MDVEYDAEKIPILDRVLIQDWAGLNDCAHFASECLKAGGISAYSLDVGQLVNQLRARLDTKTLADHVSIPAAERIVHSDIMDIGDVIAFGTPHGYYPHAHSTIYMGEWAVANHSHLNHPDYTRSEGGTDNWTNYADGSRGHDLVTLIHFSHDDEHPIKASWVFGWWTLVYKNGFKFFYYFDKTGRVFYTAKPPKNLKNAPPNPDGKGFWFATHDVQVCWTATGTFEQFSLVKSTGGLIGSYNGLSNFITATRLT